MKKITSLLCAMLLVAFMFSAFAQERATNLENKAKNNWFISLGASGNLLLGEQDNEKSVSDRFRLGGEFSVGKWFNPYFGARIQAMGGSLKGFNLEAYREGYYFHEGRHTVSYYPIGAKGNELTGVVTDWGKITRVNSDEGPGFWQEFNYASASVDLMANLTNLFRGYHNETNVIDIIPYVGLGYAQAFESETNPAYGSLIVKAGLRVNFNLSSKWAIYLEPQASYLNEDFDGYVGTRGFDAIANLMLGLQFNINRDFVTKGGLSLDEIKYLNDKINENRSLIDVHQNVLEQQQSALNKLEKCCEEKPKTNTPNVVSSVEQQGYIPEYIRFSLDSYDISRSERTKIDEAVLYLRENPSSKLLLIGYADRLTGNDSYNLKLSRKRVEAVSNELRRQGISPDRLILEWKGDYEQPYPQNDWNRVVIMVERK